MIYRNLKKSLDLICVKVHRDDTVYTCSHQHVCNKFRPDCDTWLVFSVLTSHSEIGHDCDNTLCARTLCSID